MSYGYAFTVKLLLIAAIRVVASRDVEVPSSGGSVLHAGNIIEQNYKRISSVLNPVQNYECHPESI